MNNFILSLVNKICNISKSKQGEAEKIEKPNILHKWRIHI